MTSRLWTDARAKVDDERVCRVCGSRERVQAAHTIGRKHDRSIPSMTGGKVRSALYVDPVDVVPLCETCHVKYDRRDLDLLPYMTFEEQAAAVAHVGIISATRRLTGTH